MSGRRVSRLPVRSTSNSAVTWKVLLRGVLPVDVAQGESLGFTVDGLVEALPQREEVIDLLAGAHQTVERHVAQRLDGLGDVLLGEGASTALERDDVEPAELRREDSFEESMPNLRPLRSTATSSGVR